MIENSDLKAKLDRANKTIEVLVAQRNEACDQRASLQVQAIIALEAKDREIAELKRALEPKPNGAAETSQAQTVTASS